MDNSNRELLDFTMQAVRIVWIGLVVGISTRVFEYGQAMITPNPNPVGRVDQEIVHSIRTEAVWVTWFSSMVSPGICGRVVLVKTVVGAKPERP